MGKHKGQWKDEDDELIIGDYDVITVVGLTVINVAWNKTMLDIIEASDIHNISTATNQAACPYLITTSSSYHCYFKHQK